MEYIVHVIVKYIALFSSNDISYINNDNENIWVNNLLEAILMPQMNGPRINRVGRFKNNSKFGALNEQPILPRYHWRLEGSTLTM